MGPQVFAIGRNGFDVVSADISGPQRYYDLTKSIDKTQSSPYIKENKTMKEITLQSAVLLAVKELRNLGNEFSAYNITQKVREFMNSKSFGVKLCIQKVINDKYTYIIDHEDVKGLFLEMLDLGIISGLDRKDNGTYLTYRNAPSVSAQVTSQIMNLARPASVPVVPAAPTVKPVMTNVGVSGFGPTPSQRLIDSLSRDSAFVFALSQYLTDRGGSKVTMKRIQSRFKGRSITCRQYELLLSKLGYKVSTVAKNPSQSIVEM